MKIKSSQQVSRPRRYNPNRISWRIRALSYPRRIYEPSEEGMPELSPTGVRKSALHAECSDRMQDMALPYTWKILTLKRQYQHRFDESRIEKLNGLIEQFNGTMYSKLVVSKQHVDTKKKDDKKKKKAWTETDWRKHMEYIGPLALPRNPKLQRKQKKKKWKPLPELLPRLESLAQPVPSKIYKRLSQEAWYRNPVKVQETALKYVISERVKELAKPKEIPQE